MDTKKLYSWLVSVLEKDGSIDENSVITTLDPEDRDHILFVLDHLVAKEYIKAEVIGTHTKYLPQNIANIKKTLGQLTSEPLTEKLEIEDCPVVSVPISLNDEFNRLKKKHNLRVILLKDAIRLLLESAQNEVLIASPFIEWDGMVYISDQIARAAKNGASLKLITRDLINSKDGYSRVEKLKAISKLSNIYESNKSRPDRTFSVRDYGRQISGLGRTSLHYEGIHQKMIVVDGKYAYIGSGEIRAASLMTNGEVGRIVTGDEAAFWADFFDMFWKAGRDVPDEYLKF